MMYGNLRFQDWHSQISHLQGRNFRIQTRKIATGEIYFKKPGVYERGLFEFGMVKRRMVKYTTIYVNREYELVAAAEVKS